MRIAFVITEDWYFVSHWLPTARAARALGLEVIVVTRVQDFHNHILEEGFVVYPWQSQRASLNSLKIMRSAYDLAMILRRIKPDIVHNISLQCTVIGTMAARFAGVRHIVNSVNGFGFLSLSTRPQDKLIFRFLLHVLGIISRRGVMIVPNSYDRQIIIDHGGQAQIIAGTGINIHKFAQLPMPAGPLTVAFVGRMLREKGVLDFASAAWLVKMRHPTVRFLLVGGVDNMNPGTLSEQTIKKWVDEGLLEWWGYVHDVVTVWRQAHIAVLPSYREGLPNALLEAASCGRALIATDVPGCHDVVHPQINGLLVPVQQPNELAGAINRLVEDRELCDKFGEASRYDVVQHYSEEAIGKQFQDVYRQFSD